jgi:hydroxyethylthiazole kinase
MQCARRKHRIELEGFFVLYEGLTKEAGEEVMSRSSAAQIWESLERIRESSPVVHNITNYVVMNTTANALLSLGASPVMAHAPEEASDMAGIAGALVINIGTLSSGWVKAMFLAGEKATARGIPIVLDPVGAGATPYRTATARELVLTLRPAIIRGNASEVMALHEDRGATRGVDSTDSSHDALQAAEHLAAEFGSVVCVSGETDYIVGRDGTVKVRNGHPLMTRVTGMGCTATALCGAFAAVQGDFGMAASGAMAVMGIAGELAASGADGPGSLQLRFLDVLYRLSKEDIEARLRMEG